MNNLFFIVDDDKGARAMLTEMIEDANLGEVIGESEDGAMVDNHPFALKKADILLIDLLMPNRDGIETVREIKNIFTGKIIMISQVESKELIAQAYSSGISYFITKPINKIEVLAVIKNVMEAIVLEKSVYNIHQLAGTVIPDKPMVRSSSPLADNHIIHAQFLLSELGIVGENGYQDVLDILDYLFRYERNGAFNGELPHLKDIFLKVVQEKGAGSFQTQELNREIKAAEQRVRRAIYHSLTHLASLGLNDFMNPIFENYASRFFDFEVVQIRMNEMKGGKNLPSPIRVNTKKFIFVLYFETQRLVAEM